MGLMDFVRGGVREMMIARPADNGDLIYKHPDRTIPMYAQVTGSADRIERVEVSGQAVVIARGTFRI